MMTAERLAELKDLLKHSGFGEELIAEVERLRSQRDEMALNLLTLIAREDVSGVSVAQQLKAAMKRQ